MYGPVARIALRYGVGIVVGMEVGQRLSMDSDLVAVVAVAIGAATEFVYRYAKKNGWTT